MSQMRGKQSIEFDKAPYLIAASSIVGAKEGEGPLGAYFDKVNKDPKFGEDSWEKAESQMQKEAAQLVLEKAKMKPEEIRYLFSGDLLGQLIATSFGAGGMNIPMYGLYGACSTSGESLSLASMIVSAGYAESALAVTSSHFASAEKQFRYPLEYANQRPLAATWTVTGSGAFVVSGREAPEGAEGFRHVRITGVTGGKVVDFGIKDSMNMGACMAPAACDTIYQNLEDFERKPEDYDKIITGDLGYIGQTILIDLLEEKGFDIEKQHMDCGIEIFDARTQDTHSGGSGCGCSATVLAAYILPQIEKGNWKRVLFVPTGAMLSTVSFNEGQSVPGIAYGVVLEHV
ncbi:MAG: stage V sporulation protein AD [Lachnospiraceae bacterium]|nr:stage V sporulation protein AD [Lachnospiraceae bacterium]